MASCSNTTTATNTTTSSQDNDNNTTLKLTLKKEKTRKLQWTEETVDNEGKENLGCSTG